MASDTPFPHMMKNDVPLFSTWVLSDDAARFDRFEFDTKVGYAIMPPGIWSQAQIDGYMARNRLRIDCIAWDHGVPTIIEVKWEPQLEWIGQLVSYRYYYQKEYGIIAGLLCVCNHMEAQYKEAGWQFGIRVIEVKEATLEEIIQACMRVKRDCSQLIRIPQLPDDYVP